MRDIEQNLPSLPTNRSWFDRWFDHSPILPTGQKKIAYQAAGFCDFSTMIVEFFVVIVILNAGVNPGNSLSGTLILDIVLIIGLFAGEVAARNFTLFRAFAGAILLPLIVGAQLGAGMAVLSLFFAAIKLIVDLLLLTGTTTKYRLFQACALQFAMLCIGSGITFPLVSGLLAFENPLELRCDAEVYNANEKSPSVKFPIQTIYKPGLTTKTLDEFRFAVDYEYHPADQAIRHTLTISVTASDTDELLGEQAIYYLTNWVVQSVWNTMPRRNVYFATGWVTVQHPITHRNLRYVCIPYAYQVDDSNEANLYERIINKFRFDQRR